uniref:Uncharacterized protein n=1 Tax=Parascaris equorum TaxID=6256 RepID=A0A914RSC6_PAREQ
MFFKVYLDKFLEYCTRETVRLEWGDESKRLDCAKFIVDRVIVLYIYETFSDIETNGVDIYGGWEGTEEHTDIRDTADPIEPMHLFIVHSIAFLVLIGIEIEERIWDDVLSVFQSGCWVQMIEQWSRVVDIVTRALILNPPVANTRRERTEETVRTEDDTSVELGSEDSRSEAEASVEDENAQINSVVQVRKLMSSVLKMQMSS